MSSLPRTAVAVGCAALLVASATFGGSFLSLAAPFSGEVYDTVDRDVDVVESPYGEASVRFDANGVPHVTADNERALYYAVGYLQARDRLFAMDLQRRLVSGRLSEAFGDRAVETDRFHRKMGFSDAANATWEGLQGTAAEPAIRAYTDGVNRYMETQPLPPEFALLEYEPRPWRPEDTLLVDKQIAWTLSGSFADLRRAVALDRLGADAAPLYPDRLRHDAPVIRGDSDAAPFDPAAVATSEALGGDRPRSRLQSQSQSESRSQSHGAPAPASTAGLGPLATHLDQFDVPAGVGSNSWVASGNLTGTGTATLANDPHLQLTVPPVWYEMHLSAPGIDVRGATFPGVPFVIIGRTTDVAWGVTNVGADLTDVYTYETRGDREAASDPADGAATTSDAPDEYRYRGAWRSYDTHTETIQVADGEDVPVRIRRTVHGPVLEREGREVAVAWPGFAATNETLAIYQLNHAGSMADVRAALRNWDSPPQNVVAATRTGRTLYVPAGKYPLRYTDGEVVRGDTVFNGSAGEGEWRGFTPYGESSWAGFVPFDAIPRVDDPDYLGTANQRTIDDPPFYMGTSLTYADPYRGARLYERLDDRAAGGEAMTAAFHRDVQSDVRSRAAGQFVPIATAPAARDRMAPDAAALVPQVTAWDRRMVRDSRGALVYRLWLEAFRAATFGDEFDAAGLDEGYYPREYVLGRLPADSRWFDDRTTPGVETRADIAARAMNRTAERLAAAGWDDYGDYNRLQLTHPFNRSWLNYPRLQTDGSPYTLDNYRRGSEVGSSWRMLVTFEGTSGATFPGGQSGVVWSDHYRDRLDEWVADEYAPLTMTRPEGPPDMVFRAAGSDTGNSQAAVVTDVDATPDATPRFDRHRTRSIAASDRSMPSRGLGLESGPVAAVEPDTSRSVTSPRLDDVFTGGAGA